MALAPLTSWPWHGPLARVALVALLSLALATLGAVVHPPKDALPADVPPVAVVQAMVRWDAGWYGAIADSGYWLQPGQQSPVAFFPLYPLAMRGLMELGFNRWVAGIAVSFLAALGALWVFSQWAKRVAPQHATVAFWLLALYPFAEYLYGAIYSDALFLLMAVSAFWALEQGKPGWATLLGVFATACRPVAPAVVLGLLVRSVELRRKQQLPIRAVDLLPALSGLGLAAYMAFLQWKVGDALAFAHVQGAPGWDQPPGWHTWLKVPWFEVLCPKVAPLVAIRLVGHALFTLGGLALIIPTFKRLGWGYGVYVLLAVGMPAVSSKDFQGLGRYLIAAFPLFLVLATMFESRPRMRGVVLAGSAALLGALALALGAGGYVA